MLRDNGGMLVTNNTIGPIRAIPSDAAVDTATLLDSTQVAAANDEFAIAEAEHASVEMDDNPTSGATQLISLWQQHGRHESKKNVCLRNAASRCGGADHRHEHVSKKQGGGPKVSIENFMTAPLLTRRSVAIFVCVDFRCETWP